MTNNRTPKTERKGPVTFWNIDTLYDFMRSDETFQGTLFVPGAKDIEPNLAKLTQYARENRIKIINASDWHRSDAEEISENPDYVDTFPPHCLIDTEGAENIPATRPINPLVVDWRQTTEIKGDNYRRFSERLNSHDEIVLRKNEFDPFQGNPYTEHVVNLLDPKKAVVYGVTTQICVDYAVRGLLERGVHVYIPTDAIKELPGLPLEETLKAWTDNGATLTTVENIIK